MLACPISLLAISLHSCLPLLSMCKKTKCCLHFALWKSQKTVQDTVKIERKSVHFLGWDLSFSWKRTKTQRLATYAMASQSFYRSPSVWLEQNRVIWSCGAYTYSKPLFSLNDSDMHRVVKFSGNTWRNAVREQAKWTCESESIYLPFFSRCCIGEGMQEFRNT